ncbi:sporulation protein [Bacillus dakarensis]|uniref:sporulation protein n=1 Tax=Robertmurraya dakarensis TaxID=1926278 RepID=UPI000980D925|nr:sporulation protein [Bacillus dakarensis]
MLLRKYMSLIGIGSAKVDLILEKDVYRAGDAVEGYFVITGGTISQQLKRIDCDLVMEELKTDKREVMDSVTILTKQSIQSGAETRIDFNFHIPKTASLSTNSLQYHFHTILNFDKGVQSVDHDVIRIVK